MALILGFPTLPLPAPSAKSILQSMLQSNSASHLPAAPTKQISHCSLFAVPPGHVARCSLFVVRCSLLTVSPVKSVVPCPLQINRNSKKPPRRARGKAPARILEHDEGIYNPRNAEAPLHLSPLKAAQHRTRLLHSCAPYPRYPLREFTPCAPGRSTSSCQEANPICHLKYPPHPKISLPVASRVCRDSLPIGHFFMVLASNRCHVAEAVTGTSLKNAAPLA